VQIPKFLQGIQGLAFATITALKLILMTLTPLSLDLAFVIGQVTRPSKWALAPYGQFMRGIISAWMTLPVDHPALVTSWTVDYFKGTVGLYVLVFLIKLPLLLLDILTGYALFEIVRREGLGDRKACFAFWLWFLNPYVFLVNEMWGAVDLFPTLLLLVTLGLLQVKKVFGAAATLFVATAFKLFPIMIVPIFPALRRRSKTTLLLVVSGLLGVAAYFLWVSSAGYDPFLALKQYDQFTQYFDEYLITTTADQSVGLATIGIIASYAIMWEKWRHDRKEWLDAALLVFLIYFAFGNWFPQYLIWVIPFLTADAAMGGRRLRYLASLISSALFMDIAAFYGYFSSNGHAFFFIPAVGPTLMQALSAYATFSRENLVIILLGPLARASFICTAILYSIKIIDERTNLFSALMNRLTKSARVVTNVE